MTNMEDKVQYFASKKDIMGGAVKCDTCKKYPSEILIVGNPNVTFWNFLFTPLSIGYCKNCYPK